MAKTGKQIRFGGPNLTDGQHTWFEDLSRPLRGAVTGRRLYAVVTQVKPGDVYDVGEVRNAENYVERGMAVFVGEPAAPAREDVETTTSRRSRETRREE